jgi:hypothetical protein
VNAAALARSGESLFYAHKFFIFHIKARQAQEAFTSYLHQPSLSLALSYARSDTLPRSLQPLFRMTFDKNDPRDLAGLLCAPTALAPIDSVFGGVRRRRVG